MYLYDWLKGYNLFTFEHARLERAKAIRTSAPAKSNGSGIHQHIQNYDVAWKFDLRRTGETIVTPSCTCPDWSERGKFSKMPCKHLLSVAINAEISPLIETSKPIAGLDDGAPTVPNDAPQTFNEKVVAAIQKSVYDLAAQIHDVLSEGYVPFILGPTGVGKTSAVREVALKLSSRLVEHAGSDSYTDSDLVGIEMPNGKRLPGPVGYAMEYASNMGEPVLLFLDEFLRYNPRAQESLMRLLLPISAPVAKAMGVDYDGAIRATSAPFWGDVWAPADLVKIVLAGNPWGNVPDPALIRRAVPIMAEFDDQVKELFDGGVKLAIDLSWKGTKDKTLPLPIEYGELARASGPRDEALVKRYVNRLTALDPAAAEGFASLLNAGGKL
jgi:hypothetical protein